MVRSDDVRGFANGIRVWVLGAGGDLRSVQRADGKSSKVPRASAVRVSPIVPDIRCSGLLRGPTDHHFHDLCPDGTALRRAASSPPALVCVECGAAGRAGRLLYLLPAAGRGTAGYPIHLSIADRLPGSPPSRFVCSIPPVVEGNYSLACCAAGQPRFIARRGPGAGRAGSCRTERNCPHRLCHPVHAPRTAQQPGMAGLLRSGP